MKDPHYQPCVAAYFAFYESKFHRKPALAPSDFAQIKAIVKKIESVLKDKNLTLSPDLFKLSMERFLSLAYQDKWLATHFSPFNLNKQFDIIVSKAQSTPKPDLQDFVKAFNQWKP